jgi:hypothetical protein
MDADGEICSLQNFGSSNAAKECAQSRLPFLATNEPDSRRIILVISVTSEKQDYTPHLNPLPAKRGEAEESVHAGVLQLACATIGLE